jgi:signal transduction histidine kinase
MSSARQPKRDKALRLAQIRAEQVRSVYLHSPTTTVGSLAAGFALVVILWGYVSHTMLIVWLVALCLHQTLRVYHYRRYTRASPEDQQHEGWGRLYIAAAATAGVIWGTAGVLMYVPDSLAHQAMLVLILWGFATATMTSLSVFAPAFYVLIPLTLMPIIVRMMFDPGPARVYLGIPCIIMFFVVLSFGRTIHRIACEAIEKRFENLDLIDELRAQKALAEQARQEAETANRSKTQFFAAASHDLRQPLHALGLFAAALSEKSHDPEVQQVVHSINTSVDALEGLFNAVLDISKIDAGVIRPAPVDFSLAALLERLRMEFEPEAFERRLALRVVPTRGFVHGDPVLLERILRNLISNALRYTWQGGVLVGARRRGAQVSIEVWDTGVGIEPAEQARVFEEFYQVGNPERNSRKGLGLGLSIVRRLAQLVGAPVALRSVVGRGSVFTVRVPLGHRPEAAPAAPRREYRVAHDLADRVIVVVEDEPTVLQGMDVLLRGWGATVVACATPSEALERAAGLERAPDLIIADYRLRERNVGTQAIAALRERFGAAIPAIVVSGSTTPAHLEEARAMDAHLLLKPVLPAKLRSLINFKLRST